MAGCYDARNAITIKEVPCPHCGGIMECFDRDGIHAVETHCQNCGFMILAGTPFMEETCD